MRWKPCGTLPGLDKAQTRHIIEAYGPSGACQPPHQRLPRRRRSRGPPPHGMIYLLVSDDSLFHRIVSETFLQDEEVWSWAGRRRNGEAWTGPGQPYYGDLADPATFEGAPARDTVA